MHTWFREIPNLLVILGLPLVVIGRMLWGRRERIQSLFCFCVPTHGKGCEDMVKKTIKKSVYAKQA